MEIEIARKSDYLNNGAYYRYDKEKTGKQILIIKKFQAGIALAFHHKYWAFLNTFYSEKEDPIQ